jgi:hypothetical protein
MEIAAPGVGWRSNAGTGRMRQAGRSAGENGEHAQRIARISSGAIILIANNAFGVDITGAEVAGLADPQPRPIGAEQQRAVGGRRQLREHGGHLGRARDVEEP